MTNYIKDKLHKKDILTIPNLLSFVRILLIPVIVVLYTHYERYVLAVAVIIVSGLTDIADGIIARKCNMMSDFGKFLDPLADKLTQASLIVCLTSLYPVMLYLILFMLFKETFLFILSYIAFKKTSVVKSAKWFGKVTTVLLYVVMVVLFLFPEIPLTIAQILIGLCFFVVALSLVLYTQTFIGVLINKTPTSKTL